MLFRKKGMPEEGEVVLCTISKIMYHSIFANLDEYEKSGIIHISEVSPGRIRNIRDYVTEGKKVVCKVLRVNTEKGHIDLSLRRVNEGQKREKLDEIKQEQKAEKILEFVAKNKKIKTFDLYNDIKEEIFKKYESLHSCFEDVVLSDLSLESLGVKKDIAVELEEVIRQRIKPPEVEIKGDLNIITYDPDGVDIIKKGLAKATEKNEDVIVRYLGTGKYGISVKSEDYKSAEKILKASVDPVIKFIEKKGGKAEFKRIEK